MSKGRLILLPGLGADQRVFGPQLEAFGQLEVPAWLPPEPVETLPQYAARMASAIDFSPDDIVGGMSFGGMVACEMLRLRPARAGLLIASVTSPVHLPRRIRALGPLGRRAPVAGWRTLQGVARSLEVFALAPDMRLAFLKQFSRAQPAFLRWAARAVLDWPAPRDSQPMLAPICHIHGTRDPILPHRYVQADTLIEGGDHLISMRRPDAVNRYLDQVLSGWRPPAAPASSQPAAGTALPGT